MDERAPVQDKAIELNGLRFHHRDWGNDGAPPLILLHAYTSHARSWDTFARAVRGRHRIMALDLRGHGETAWAPEYSPELLVDDIGAFARALGLARRASGRRTAVRAVAMPAISSGLGERLNRDKLSSMRRELHGRR